MAGRNFSLRVAMYSHDTFGLGHITRTLRLARATVEAIPNASVLVLTGSPIAHRLTFPQGVEYVKLPSVRKRGPETYVPRELGIPFWRLRKMRVRILRDALRLFRPHIFFVDNVPLGMKGEILPSLEDLKKHGTALHLNLRDILDEPGIVRSQWAEDGTHDVLNSLYDEVHVFGDRSIHDSAAEYGLPACKTLFHGYIAPPEPAARERVLPTRRRNGLPSVLITIGGGEDGAEILRCALEAERRLDAVRRLKFDLVLGPLMGVEEAEVIRTTARGRGGVSACEFVEDLADFMPEYDLVVSMGGYNTLCEVMTRAQRSLVIPRIHPRREQELRARALEARGILTLIHPGELTPERFGTALAESLERGPVLPSPRAPRLEGVGCFKRRLEEIAPSFRDPAPRRQKRPEQLVAGVDTRRRGLVRSVLGLGIVGFLACSAGFARADLRPKAVNAEMLVGYDTNVLDASDAEIMAFETHDPGSFFVVEHMKDAALQMSIDGRWALAAGSKTDARLRYTRLQYLRETIRSENHYSLQWGAQRLCAPSQGQRRASRGSRLPCRSAQRVGFRAPDRSSAGAPLVLRLRDGRVDSGLPPAVRRTGSMARGRENRLRVATVRKREARPLRRLPAAPVAQRSLPRQRPLVQRVVGAIGIRLRPLGRFPSRARLRQPGLDALHLDRSRRRKPLRQAR